LGRRVTRSIVSDTSTMISIRRVLVTSVASLLVATACGGDPSPQSEAAARQEVLSQRFPDVVDARFDPIGESTWSVRVTISSPYDTPERYADAWRVLSLDGEVLGTRELVHDHANEQPFTRALNNVMIPLGTDAVLIEARDLINGWSGDTVEFRLPDE